MMVGPTPANSLARHWARAPHPEAIPRRSPIRETSAAKAQPFRMRGGDVDSTAHTTGSSRAEQRKALLLVASGFPDSYVARLSAFLVIDVPQELTHVQV